MIRNIVLFALVVVIFYCAAARAPRAAAYALATPARADVRVRRQFIPGTLTALHAPAREVVATLHAPAGPQA